MSMYINQKGDGKRLYPDDSGQIYYDAYSFYAASKRFKGYVYNHENVKGNCVVPYIVNLMFSAELFLKSILVAEGVDFGKTHDLSKLFDLISDDAIKNEIADACPQTRDIGQRAITFEEALEDIKDSFEYWRYSFEKYYPIMNLGFAERFVEATMKEAQKVKIEKVNR